MQVFVTHHRNILDRADAATKKNQREWLFPWGHEVLWGEWGPDATRVLWKRVIFIKQEKYVPRRAR